MNETKAMRMAKFSYETTCARCSQRILLQEILQEELNVVLQGCCSDCGTFWAFVFGEGEYPMEFFGHPLRKIKD